jgi:hypothetical protein
MKRARATAEFIAQLQRGQVQADVSDASPPPPEYAASFDGSMSVWQTSKCAHVGCTGVAGLYAHWCDAHAVEEYGLRIACSRLPNTDMLALWTERPFAHKAIVCRYAGDVLDEAQYEARYPDTSQAAYCLVLSVPDYPRSLVTVDARSSQACVARYINDGTPSGEKANCYFAHVVDRVAGTCRVNVVALRDLVAGEELLVAYGKDYWVDRAPIEA